ncbi:MAG: kelch repeat-containing protein [Promethearchaeota archaeon]
MKSYLIFILLLSSAIFLNTDLVLSMDIAQVSEGPGTREGPCLAYDPFSNVTMLFGGDETIEDTWFYDYATNTWTEHAGTSPPGRINAGMVYCGESNEMIMYGGLGDTRTWSFNCETQTWSQVTTTHNPGPHQSHAMAFDSVENAVILFGGISSSAMTPVDDIWMFDCETRDWTELHPPTVPLARYGHVMTYDVSNDMIIMALGNTFEDGFQNDFWTYDISTNTWTEITVIGNPDSLKWSSMVYDSINEKNILFGGCVIEPSYEAVDDTCEFDAETGTWTVLEPASAPVPRIAPGLAFDSREGIVVLHGGVNAGGDTKYSDTWTFSYTSNTWTDMGLISTTTTSTTSGTNTVSTPPDLLTISVLVGVFGIAIFAVAFLLRKRS